jgi:peptidoglycan hydrolase-like protein with peptidoglycan-binding domain
MKSILAGSTMLVALLIVAAPAHAQYGGGGVPAVIGSIGGGVPHNTSSYTPPDPQNSSIVPVGQVLGAAVHHFLSNLHLGSTGTDVTALQEFLIGAGYSIPAGATGYFGAETRTAVIAYQTANGIQPTSGYVGPITIALLNKGLTPTLTDEQNAKANSLVANALSTLTTISSEVSLSGQQKLAAALSAVDGLITSLKAL